VRDVQSEKDERNISIDKVGVSDLRYPVSVRGQDGELRHTVATVSMSVELPHHFRGTHMSRFLEVMARHHLKLDLHDLGRMLRDMLDTFHSRTAHLDISFPYFLLKKAPVSGIESPMEYQCRVEASLSDGGKPEILVEVGIPVHNLCPCSKEISEAGAHNQRGLVTIRLKSTLLVWFEEIIAVAEASASSPLYSLLKREDEKWVTEQAYKNPKFVEDTARDIALALNADARVRWYSVEVKNYESIHNHNAYASITKPEAR